MTDRTVHVDVEANATGYIQTFQRIQRETAEAASEAAKFAEQGKAMTGVGTAMVATGALIAAGVAVAVNKFMDFDKQMSSVQASTLETADNMALLRQAALDAGADTVFSATEAAQAEEELAKAGVSTADVLNGGLTGALSLASAGGLEVKDAAELAATALTQFKLAGSDVPHVADLLAAGAGKAQGSVEDLGAALKQGGLVASQAGQNIEDTTGVLSAFAAAGLVGSDSGTSLKTMLLALENPSVVARGVLEQYNIQVYDANGNMKDFAGIAEQLKSRLGGLTAEQRNSALATIFGSDAVRAASVLYDEGASGIADWTDKVNDQGYAAEVAAQKLDNLSGDLEFLSGSFDTALIQTGSAANDVLRDMVQGVTGLVDAFNGAPPIIQTSTLMVAALLAGVLLLGGGFLITIPKIVEFGGALTTLSASQIPAVAAAAGGATRAISATGAVLRATAGFLTSGWGVAFVAAAAGVMVLNKAVNDGKTQTEAYQNALITAKSASDVLAPATKQWEGTKVVFGDYTQELERLPELLNKAKAGQDNFLNNFSLDSNDFNALQALRDMGKELGTLAQSNLPAAQKAFKSLADEYHLTSEQQLTLLNLAQPYKDALTDQASKLGLVADDATLLRLAQEGGTESTDSATGAWKRATDQAAELQDQLTTLFDTMAAGNKVGQDAVTSNADYLKSLADVNDYILRAKDGQDGYNLTLDRTTEAGAANEAMLAGLAQSGQASAKAQYELDGNTQTYRETLQSMHDNIYEQAKAFGVSDEQAANLADTIAAIPTDFEWKAIADTSDAQKKVDAFNAAVQLAKQNPVINVTMTTDQITRHVEEQYGTGDLLKVPGQADGGTIPGFAGGGTAVGAGGYHTDSMLTRLSAGEEVVQMPYAEKFRAELKQMNVGQTPNFTPRYVAAGYGGAPGPTSSQPVTHKSATVNVYPTPGMSERAIGDTAVDRLDWEFGRQP